IRPPWPRPQPRCSTVRRFHRLRFPTPWKRCRAPRWPSMPNSQTDYTAAPATAPGHDPAATVGWRWAPAWMLAHVALWPAPGYAEGVLVLGALLAIYRLVASRFRGGVTLLSPQAWALTSVLFFAYWLAELVSAFDSVGPGRALRQRAVELR